MAKKINLSKNEAFFEGFKIVLKYLNLFLDDNNKLCYNDGAAYPVVDDRPCYTPKAALDSFKTAMLTRNADESYQYPNFATALGYAFGNRNIVGKLQDDDENFYLPKSVSYYEKALSKIFGGVYRFHYKLVVTDNYVSIGYYDSLSKLPNNSEFGGGLYKVEVEGHPETTTYSEFGSEYGLGWDLEKGTYDVYFYSTQPAININNDVFYCQGGTLTALESEHLVQYVLTSTDAGKAVISGYLGSIVDVQADASVTVEGDAETNLFTLSFDRAGQYIVKLFCDESAEEIRVQDSENCSFGNRTLVW